MTTNKPVVALWEWKHEIVFSIIMSVISLTRRAGSSVVSGPLQQQITQNITSKKQAASTQHCCMLLIVWPSVQMQTFTNAVQCSLHSLSEAEHDPLIFSTATIQDTAEYDFIKTCIHHVLNSSSPEETDVNMYILGVDELSDLDPPHPRGWARAVYAAAWKRSRGKVRRGNGVSPWMNCQCSQGSGLSWWSKQGE